MRPNELQGLLMRHKPDIVHFSGHGKLDPQDGDALLFQGDDGESYAIPAPVLGQIFKTHGETIRCVVLNACHGLAHLEAIGAHIPCVVGMSDAVPDDMAIGFAVAFYEALAYGESVATAIETGRSQIDIQGEMNSGVVQLAGCGDAAEVVFVEE